MGFRVSSRSSFTFETDLPPSCRDIHPSGVLHAFRSHGPPSGPGPSGGGKSIGSAGGPPAPGPGAGAGGREEHAFAWIADCVHVDVVISHFAKFGFRRHDVVFVPYSTKANWTRRYPHAAPALECDDGGVLTVFLNWRPYPNGLGGLDYPDPAGGGDRAAVESGDADGDEGEGDPLAATLAVARTLKEREGGGGDDDRCYAPAELEKPKRIYPSRAVNMVQDNRYLPDPERDELHIEIYTYLAWLRAKLEPLEREAAAIVAASNAAMEEEDDDGGDDDGGNERRASKVPRPRFYNIGVDVSELRHAVDKLEKAFSVIPHVKREREAARKEMEKERERLLRRGDDDDDAGAAVAETENEGASFLEETLAPTLSRMVKTREAEGKPRRRVRKRIKPRGTKRPRVEGEDFEAMFRRLEEYKEEHGDCRVFKNYVDENGDNHLGKWVRGVRERRAKLLREGLPFDEPPSSGKPLFPRAVTSERYDRLTSLGFVWNVGPPIVPWETRFAELMEYYEEHGRWPSQSVPGLGEWVHKQRGMYARNEEGYMKHKAPRLDEVGFEWTPRGNTRMKWEDGFQLLVEFGRQNGHYVVPNPLTDDIPKAERAALVKSDEYRLYNWVESLHKMYRSYKLGRQSGSLTDERVVLLIKHGFLFRKV